MAHTESFPRQYLATFDYGDGPGMTLCTTDRMRKAVENAAYSGDDDDARYYTLIAGEMVEVTFRAATKTYTDDDDYMHTAYGVFPVMDLGAEDPGVRIANMDDEPIETFHVRIDGRA